MMRVTGVLRAILIALFTLCLLSQVAGAIYIEGQPIPDDGLVHILSAEDNAAATPGDMLPANDMASVPIGGIASLTDGFPAMMTSELSAAGIPATDDMIGIDIDGTIDSTMQSSIPEGWDIFDLSGFGSDMPLLDGWSF